jgi:predicted aspartyl protease
MVPFVLDTGADVTVITEKTFSKLACSGTDPSKVLKGADGKVLKVMHETSLVMTSKRGTSTTASAFVVKGATNNLLGKQEIRELQIISVVCNVRKETITDDFQDMLEGLGTLPEVFKINLKPINLRVPRRVPRRPERPGKGGVEPDEGHVGHITYRGHRVVCGYSRGTKKRMGRFDFVSTCLS